MENNLELLSIKKKLKIELLKNCILIMPLFENGGNTTLNMYIDRNHARPNRIDSNFHKRCPRSIFIHYMSKNYFISQSSTYIFVFSAQKAQDDPESNFHLPVQFFKQLQFSISWCINNRPGLLFTICEKLSGESCIKLSNIDITRSNAQFF